MSEWIGVKNALPINDCIVKVKILCLFSFETECLFLNKYFSSKGENMTPWVTHWMPLPDEPK